MKKKRKPSSLMLMFSSFLFQILKSWLIIELCMFKKVLRIRNAFRMNFFVKEGKKLAFIKLE